MLLLRILLQLLDFLFLLLLLIFLFYFILFYSFFILFHSVFIFIPAQRLNVARDVVAAYFAAIVVGLTIVAAATAAIVAKFAHWDGKRGRERKGVQERGIERGKRGGKRGRRREGRQIVARRAVAVIVAAGVSEVRPELRAAVAVIGGTRVRWLPNRELPKVDSGER